MARWAQLAGLNEWSIRRFCSAKASPSETTLAKLRLALDRFEAGAEGGVEALSRPQIRALCSALMVAAAQALGVPVALCHAVDTKTGARGYCADHLTRKAHLARGLVFYVANQVHGISQAELAHAHGMAKAPICRLIPRIEDARDDAAFDAVVVQVGRLINQGGVL